MEARLRTESGLAAGKFPGVLDDADRLRNDQHRRQFERCVQEHRQRHRDRSARRKASHRGDRLAERRRLQRLLRVEGRRCQLDEGQPDRCDSGGRHRQRDLRVLGQGREAVRGQPVAEAPQQADRNGQQLPRRRLVSKNGSPAGPWGKIAESHKLANSGSALKQSVSGKGYGPGIQAWYNQLLLVDPTNPDHVYLGLEEVYETKDGGSNWTTPGPYWNFYFPCWAPDSTYTETGGGNRCPLTTHPDQHSIAIGTRGGVPTVFVGNDGGVYSRLVDGKANGNGNATDWTTLNDGTMDALQYYAVDVGKVNPANSKNPPGADAGEVIISGGLQDNGGSILLSGDDKMSSNFGGDGGDVLVDPNDGCNIVQEYVVLAMRVTNKCARQDTLDAFLDVTKANTRSIAPPDIARFIAPFTGNATNIKQWLAGGYNIWWQTKGFDISGPGEWKSVHKWANPGQTTTTLAMSGTTAVAAFCGPCNNNGFTRGVALGRYDAAGSANNGWTWTDVTSGLPNRYVSGAAVDGDAVYVVLNGFSRRFTEGPGADQGHVFKATVNANGSLSAWTSIDGNFPDVPANSIAVLPDGSLVVGTDLGVVYKPAASAIWQRLGADFPVTVAIDVELGPDNKLYVATHGRGVWSTDSPVAASGVAGVAGGTGSAGAAGGAGTTPPANGGNGKKG